MRTKFYLWHWFFCDYVDSRWFCEWLKSFKY